MGTTAPACTPCSFTIEPHSGEKHSGTAEQDEQSTANIRCTEKFEPLQICQLHCIVSPCRTNSQSLEDSVKFEQSELNFELYQS